RPVRVGNAADTQLQLDAYGELVDAVARVYHDRARLDRETSAMLRDLGQFVCESWERPDRGIWETRGPPRAFTHSRAMSWVALDRLIAMHASGTLRARLPVERFEHNRRLIRESIERHAWNERLGAYTQFFDGDTLDASAVLLGWYGFHDPRDPRMISTADR